MHKPDRPIQSAFFPCWDAPDMCFCDFPHVATQDAILAGCFQAPSAVPSSTFRPGCGFDDAGAKIDATVAPSPHLCIFNRACKQSSCSVPVCRNKTRLKPGVVDVELSLANRGCNQSDELFNCGHLLPLRVVTCSEPPRPAPPRPVPPRAGQFSWLPFLPLRGPVAVAHSRCGAV